MKTGLERHLTTKFCPTCTGRKSTSTIPAAHTSFAGHIVCTNLQATTRTKEVMMKPVDAAKKYRNGRRSAWPMGKRFVRKSKVPSGTVLIGCGAFSAQPTGRKFSGENFAIDVI